MRVRERVRVRVRVRVRGGEVDRWRVGGWECGRVGG